MARFLPVWDGRVWLSLVHTVAAWDPHSFRRCDVAHRGRHAARQGRYGEASVLFEQPLGALDEAIDVLERARERVPGEMAVRLFLGFAYLRKNEPG